MPDRRPVVKLDIIGRGSFTLERVSQKSFELKIPNCALANSQLELPYFPPHDFLGFTFVHPKQQGANVVVSIGVEHGVRISSLPNQDEVWLRTINR